MNNELFRKAVDFIWRLVDLYEIINEESYPEVLLSDYSDFFFDQYLETFARTAVTLMERNGVSVDLAKEDGRNPEVSIETYSRECIEVVERLSMIESIRSSVSDIDEGLGWIEGDEESRAKELNGWASLAKMLCDLYEDSYEEAKDVAFMLEPVLVYMNHLISNSLHESTSLNEEEMDDYDEEYAAEVWSNVMKKIGNYVTEHPDSIMLFIECLTIQDEDMEEEYDGGDDDCDDDCDDEVEFLLGEEGEGNELAELVGELYVTEMSYHELAEDDENEEWAEAEAEEWGKALCAIGEYVHDNPEKIRFLFFE